MLDRLRALPSGETTQEWLVSSMRRVAIDAAAAASNPRLAPCLRARYRGAIAAVLIELRSLGDLDALVHHYYFEREALIARVRTAIGQRRLSPVTALDAAVLRRLHELGAADA